MGFLYNGLGLALLPALYALGRTFSPPQIVCDWRSRFLLLWLLPPLAFYILVHIGNPGYVLSFLPPLCVYSALATFVFFEDLREAAALLGDRPAVASGPDPAPAAGPGWPRRPPPPCWPSGPSTPALFLFASGEGRLREISQIDRTLERQLAEVQRRYPPASSVIFAYDRSRQYRYYLPRHKIELLFDVAVAGAVTDTSRYWERRQALPRPARGGGRPLPRPRPQHQRHPGAGAGGRPGRGGEPVRGPRAARGTRCATATSTPAWAPVGDEGVMSEGEIPGPGRQGRIVRRRAPPDRG